jgi:putative ABC transport system ATP-binding protein
LHIAALNPTVGIRDFNMPNIDRDRASKKLLEFFDGDVDAAIASIRVAAAQGKRASKLTVHNTNPVVVSLTDVFKKYKLGKQRITAVKNISVEIKQGEFVAITGPSGSGKSTLLHLIGGLDKPSQGQVMVNDHNISRLSDRQLSVFRNRTVGFVFQFFYLQPFLDLKTNLAVPGMFARLKRAERKQKAIELATSVGLSERLQHLPKELSGGQMQRAAIARALLNNPKIILADEPTGNLDSSNGQAIIDLFEQIRKDFDTTIVVVTHDPAIAARAEREIIMKDGEIVG